uniref:NADH-ubiquinone oxidoreductase chain 5 n=1 Tax=Stenus clavicornis TaxID=1202167 RepID=A0A191ZS09_9COLE|nr:NADH dehydrogenase subunit 5 [Stenus clavicornis]
MVKMYLIYVYLLFFMFLLSFFLSLYFLMLNFSFMIQYEILSLNGMEILMTVLFDWMSMMFMSFVLLISFLVIIYSSDYMENDFNINRFILLVFLFIMSMIFLIISPNLMSILLGWDGLGLVSYCLVIYYQNNKSNNAGMITALTNRIGDVAILLAISWMMNYGSWNFIFYLDFFKNDYFMNLVCFFVILASMTKSAQIPFSAWLPAAMAAPTPVSSLVHSSTLVTAGVYLLIRFSGALTEMMLMVLLLLSLMTMFMAGLSANFEFDLKKIIALSTLSQLGLMMSILCNGEIYLAFFHLLMHALFKATLFMSAGVIIHNFMNNQDIRKMGNLINLMPKISIMFLISNLSLCGFPFLSGFYSKDLMLEFISMNYLNLYVYFLYFISTGLTVSYTIRMLNYLMLNNLFFYSLNSFNELSSKMINSIYTLSLLVIFSGSMFNWMIMNSPYLICLPLYMKLLPMIISIIGILMGMNIYYLSINFSNKSNMLNMFFGLMWNLPLISSYMMIYKPLFFSKLYFYKIDQGWSEFLGGQNLYNNIIKSSFFFQYMLKNNFKMYMFLTVMWIFLLFIFWFYLNSLISA